MQEVYLQPSWGPLVALHKIHCAVLDMPEEGEVQVGDLYWGPAPQGPSYLKFKSEKIKPGEVIEFTGPEGSACTLLVEAQWDNPENYDIPNLYEALNA